MDFDDNDVANINRAINACIVALIMLLVLIFMGGYTMSLDKGRNKPEYSIELLKSNKIKVNNKVIELDSLEEFIDKDNL